MINEQVKENNQDKEILMLIKIFLEKKACTSAYVQVTSQESYCVHMHVCAHVCVEVPATMLVIMSCQN